MAIPSFISHLRQKEVPFRIQINDPDPNQVQAEVVVDYRQTNAIQMAKLHSLCPQDSPVITGVVALKILAKKTGVKPTWIDSDDICVFSGPSTEIYNYPPNIRTY